MVSQTISNSDNNSSTQTTIVIQSHKSQIFWSHVYKLTQTIYSFFKSKTGPSKALKIIKFLDIDISVRLFEIDYESPNYLTMSELWCFTALLYCSVLVFLFHIAVHLLALQAIFVNLLISSFLDIKKLLTIYFQVCK